jgi:hypothetical protein
VHAPGSEEGVGFVGTSILTYPHPIADTAPVEGKFVQLRLAGRDVLLFAAASEHRYHNQILGRFLSAQGIPHRWEGAEKLVVDDPSLAVLGGGRFRLDLPDQRLRVWDASGVYGRFDGEVLSAQLASADPPWRGLALSVG